MVYTVEVVSSPSLEIFNRKIDAHLTQRFVKENQNADELQNSVTL